MGLAGLAGLSGLSGIVPGAVAVVPPGGLDSFRVETAYSVVRRLYSAYAGPLCRVLVGSGEIDIGVGSNGYLDLSALLTASAGGSARILRLYNQGTLGSNGDTAVSATGPFLVQDGSVILAGGFPAMHFSPSSLIIPESQHLHLSPKILIRVQVGPSMTTLTGRPFGNRSGTLSGYIGIISPTIADVFFTGRAETSVVGTGAGSYAVSPNWVLFDLNTVTPPVGGSIDVNGVTVRTETANGFNAANSLHIGRQGASSPAQFVGYISEFFVSSSRTPVDGIVSTNI